MPSDTYGAIGNDTTMLVSRQTMDTDTYDETGDDIGEQEEWHAGVDGVDEHAVPHRLDPLAAQHAEDDHEAVQEVLEVPPATAHAL